MPGNPDSPNPTAHRVSRRYLLVAVTAVAAITLLSSCEAKDILEPLGVCVRSDGVIVRRGITQDACTQLCPDCTWTTADS